MLTQEIFNTNIIPHEKLYPKSINQFLALFKDSPNEKIEEGLFLDFEIETGIENHKLNPILKLAKPEDAKQLVEISKEVYNGTYPYKEMEDENAVRGMILSPNYHFILFKDMYDNTLGCFKCILDFENKKGYMGGFMVKKKYQGVLDVVKAIMGSYIWMWGKYGDRIMVWYCENRTAHCTSQYMTAVCGIKSIAIFPNKDIFFDKIETDIMGIIYVEKALKELRSNSKPKIIQEALSCFLYSNERYQLGDVQICFPKINLNKNQINQFRNSLVIKISKKKFGYEKISYKFEGSDSYFKFIYTISNQNFEKTTYKIKNLEELFVFLQEFKSTIELMNIRYSEVFVSAYKPTHQQLFHDIGFTPRGYIPSWEYNKKTDEFEDYIVFNYYIGEICSINLLPEDLDLLNMLRIKKN
ncbi:MAG: hypothetical protein ACFFHV_23855 [Promethearchaeota archaeon]